MMQGITILNVSSNATSSKYKVMAAFFYSMTLIPGLVMYFQFKYMTKFQRYEHIDQFNKQLKRQKSDMLI